MVNNKASIYENYIKRLLDFVLSLVALIVLSPVLIALLILGSIKMKGHPLFFQMRPGKDERIFKLIKFRTMVNERDNKGDLLPDEERLTPYGRFLRSTSLDELPQLINILKGDMSIVGPRPQLVKDMVFMTKEQRKRHTVRQGLTGLAQINGRNGTLWENKLAFDLQYIEEITFKNDLSIILKTVMSVIHKEGISTEGMETAEDLGDYILRVNKISSKEYYEKLQEADRLLEAVS